MLLLVESEWQFFFDDKLKFFNFTILYTLVSNDQSPWLKSVLCIILYIKYPNS